MKQTIIKTIIALLFLMLFNVLFFIFREFKPAITEWVSYGFINMAYLCLLCTPLFGGNKKGLTALIASLYLRALVYFLIELAIGVFFIIINPESPTLAIIIQSILLFLFLILQLISILANDSTSSSIGKQRSESNQIQSLALRIKMHLNKVEDSELRKKVLRSYDSLNNSSVEGFPETSDSEETISIAVNSLCDAIDKQDENQIRQKAKELTTAVQYRNSLIATLRRS